MPPKVFKIQDLTANTLKIQDLDIKKLVSQPESSASEMWWFVFFDAQLKTALLNIDVRS